MKVYINSIKKKKKKKKKKKLLIYLYHIILFYILKKDEMIYSGIISNYGPVIVTLKYFDNNQYCLCNIKTTLVI